MAGRARTVTGDVDAARLGAALCHEHLVTRPAERLLADGPDLLLDDEERAASELERFRAAGGGALIEVTTPEFGRDVAALVRLSERTGIHLVATAGHVSEEYWRGVLDLEARSESELVDELVRELVDGIGSTGARAGVIKIGTSLERATSTERKLIRAAAAAQRETGAPITTHTTAGTAAAEQATLLESAGADLERVCIGHLDRRLVWSDHLALARTGVYLGYDCVSKEQYEPDRLRAEFVARLAHEGFGDRVLLSGDLARRSYLEAWGGAPGYRYLLERFLPLVLEAGLDEQATRSLVVDNPARFVAWV